MRRSLLILFLILEGCASIVGQPKTIAPADPSSIAEISFQTKAHARLSLIEQTVREYHLKSHWYRPKAIPNRPGYFRLNDGEVMRMPPDDSSAPNGGSCERFSGDVPPSCTTTGAFRRMFSKPGMSYITNGLGPVASNTHAMPRGPSGPQGYYYLEGWPLANLNGPNTEGGLQYSAANNWLVPYEKVPSATNAAVRELWVGTKRFLVNPAPIICLIASTSRTSSFAEDCPKNQTCAVVLIAGSCAGAKYNCNEWNDLPDAGWSVKQCCVLASMMTIAESSDAFSNGDLLGPTLQTVGACTSDETACSSLGMAGAQSFPNDPTRIVVQSFGGLGQEMDSIDLHL
jgi:hypothetical protein